MHALVYGTYIGYIYRSIHHKLHQHHQQKTAQSSCSTAERRVKRLYLLLHAMDIQYDGESHLTRRTYYTTYNQWDLLLDFDFSYLYIVDLKLEYIHDGIPYDWV